MTSFEPFPFDVWREISQYPGNNKCCDCPSLDADWANINHGTLVCLECAGKHRSLGVHISFIRSTHMDTWSKQQIEMMRQGGNGQLRDYFRKLNLEHSSIPILYCTKGACHYRERLKDRVERIMRGEIKGDRKKLHAAANLSVSIFPEFQGTPLALNESVHNFIFPLGAMGMTLTRNQQGYATVSKLVSGGTAETLGVRLHDTLVSVGGKVMVNYEEILQSIPIMSRPLRLTFLRIDSANEELPFPITITTSPTSLSKRLQGELAFVPPLAPLSSKRHGESPKATSRTFSFRNANIVITDPRRDNSRKNLLVSLDTVESNKHESEELANRGVDSCSESAVDGVMNDMLDQIESAADGHSTPELNHGDILDVDEGSQDSGEESSDIGGDKPLPHMGDELQDESLFGEMIEDGEEGDSESDDDCDRLEFDLNKNNENTIILESGSAVKVLRKGRWRSAQVDRMHSDGSFKIKYRGTGSCETHVIPERICVVCSTDAVDGEVPQSLESGASSSPRAISTDSLSHRYTPTREQLQEANELIPAGEDEAVDTRNISLSSLSIFPDSPHPSSYTLMNLSRHAEDRNGGKNSGGGIADSFYRKLDRIQSNSIEDSSECNLDDWIGPDDCDTRELTAVSTTKDFRVIFERPPLGLTLSKGPRGEAEVTRVNPDGQAHKLDVRAGDVLVGIEFNWVKDFEEAMTLLSTQNGVQYPLALVFRRKSLSFIGTNGTHSFDRTAGREREKTSEIGTGFAGALEYEVVFQQGALGAKFEEVFAAGHYATVVTEVKPGGQAAELGVSNGSTVVRINGAEYISHAHCIATLRHFPRPLRVRFRKL